MRIWAGILFSLYVVAMTYVAFSPRPNEPQPKTQLLVNNFTAMNLVKAGNRLVSVGDDGNIFYSDDQGQHWSNALVEPQKKLVLTDIDFADAQNGAAVGYDSQILLTNDGGKSWRETYANPDLWEPLLGITSLGAAQGGGWLAYGSYGKLLRSNDGKSWQSTQMPEGLHINKILSNKIDRLIMVGEAGLVMISTDHGQTWKRVPEFYKGSFFGGGYLGGDRWIVYGMSGKIFKSDNNGDSWQIVNNPVPSTVFNHAVMPNGDIVFVGRGGSIVLADPNLTLLKTIASGGLHNITAAIPIDQKTLMISGEQGVRTRSIQ